MNPTVVVIVMIVVGAVSGRVLMRRFPTVSKVQIFCATAAWVGGVSVAGRPGGDAFWHYTGLTVAIVAGSFLMFALFRRWSTPTPTGSV